LQGIATVRLKADATYVFRDVPHARSP
jgi:hypothetical protein